MPERVSNGKIFVESSGKYRSSSEILNSGEPARLRVAANQLRSSRVENEIAPALAVAVAKKDFATIDLAAKNYAEIKGAEKRIGALIAEALAKVEEFRPKPEAEEPAA